MDLKINVEQELWEVLEKNYESEEYSNAILDAMHLLTETIRNKTGLEGDGSSLVGQAFGGDNPKIQLNKLQTESEKNIQKGIQEILKGLYTAVRNPRSHDKQNDTKEDADSIIYFINYMLRLIDKSKISFEKSIFLQRVFDEHYVRSKEYSNLLVGVIPKRQRMDIAIAVILKRKSGNIYSLHYFMESLFDKLEDHEINQVYRVISEDLMYTNLEEDIRTILHVCPAKYWNRIDKAVKIRIEHIVKNDIELGKYDIENKKCTSNGSLGTWVSEEHLRNFEDINSWTQLIVKKIQKEDDEEIDYIDAYFWHKICSINKDSINIWLKNYFKNGLKNKDEAIIRKLDNEIKYDSNHPWWEVFKEELKEYPDIKSIEFDWL